jgi:glycosyltransferase involved in cell wall biosynthesis
MSAKQKLDVVIPVYNEEIDLPKNIPTLHSFLKKEMSSYDWKIIIADNGPSKDKTADVSKRLEEEYKGVEYMCIPRPGRGGALKEVWLNSGADYLSYMDVDLSSDLKFFPRLIKSLENGADISIGSRLAVGSKVHGRTLTREIMSQGYNILIKIFFWTSFHDAQCGFKAITNEAAQKLLPTIEDKGWFFDSEVLIIGEKSGFKIAEVPIIWRDDPASTVKVAKTAWGDIKGLMRLFRERPWKKVRRR